MTLPRDSGTRNTRTRRRRRKPAPPRLVPHGPGGQMLRPAPRRVYHPGPTATGRSYVSQGRQVERTANRQRARARRRRLTAPGRQYVSTGHAVEKRANQLARQTRRVQRFNRTGTPAFIRALLGPAGFYGASGSRRSTGRAGGGSFASAQLFSPTEARRGAADLKTLGEGPFLGAYQLGRGTYEAATGQGTGRLKRLGKGVVSGTLHSAPGELLTGHPGKALKVAQHHPLIAAIDTAALFSGVGKVAGAGARVGSGYRVGSTVRPPIALSEDAGAVKAGAYREREYSKGLDRQIPQRVADSKREPVRDANGKVVTVKQRGRDVPVLKPTQGAARRGNRREADARAGRANAVERHEREVQGRLAKIKGVRGQRGRDLVAMVYEGTVPSLRHVDSDGHVLTGHAAFARYLTDHADRLDREYKARIDEKGFRHSGEAEYNRYRAKLAREAADDPRVLKQAEKIVAEGTRLGHEGRKLDTEAAKLGVVSDEARAKGAALIPGKIEHLGGRHFTVEAHAKLERDALAREQRLRDELQGVKDGKRVRMPDAQRKMELQRELAAARAHRIAVSGRDPARVVAHETARDTAEKLRAREKASRVKIARLERTRQRLLGTQASRRGRRASAGEGRAASAEERSKLAKIDREIKAARAEAADHGKAARKAEHELKRTPMPPARAAIRTAEGKQLPDAQAERFFRERGRDPGTVGYLPHVPPRNRAFHQRFAPGTRPVADKPGPKGTRTGEAYRKGATESSADLIRQQHVKLRTQIVKAQQLDKLVRERGLRHPQYDAVERKAAAGEQLSKHERRLLDADGYMTGREAEEYGQRIVYDTRTGPRDVILAPNGERLVPMRAYADRLSGETKRIIREDLQGPGAMESLGQRLLNDRVIPPGELKGTPARNVVMMPADVVERLEKHLAPAGELERMVQMLNRPFRFAVLAQPRWLVGNFVEPYFIRLPGVGSGVVNVPGLLNDIRISRKVIRAGKRSDDPKVRQAALELEAQQTGGLFIGGRGASNRRAFEDTKLYGQMVARVPATRQMAEMAHKLGQVLIAPGRGYFWINREGIERWAQHAAIGRSARRDMVEFFGSWQKATRFGEEAAREAAKGLVNTPTQARFLREQQKLLGQYGDFSPTMRRVVQGPMPFLPWALNSARFVYWTMPAERTILTALLLKTQDVTAKEWAADHQDVPPDAGSLRLDARRNDRGFVPGVRYTPYGLTGPVLEGDTEGLNQAFPQLQGPTQALSGIDPFGNPLQAPRTASNPQGKVRGIGGRGAVAVNQLAEALIPYLATARRVREHGETGYSTSTVFRPQTKPGTSHGMSAATRTFYPFRPTYLRQSAAGRVSGPAPKLSRADQILERRARRVQSGGSSAQSRLDAILEKRAARLGGG